jgi:BMFP domain-containing protein YqiC
MSNVIVDLSGIGAGEYILSPIHLESVYLAAYCNLPTEKFTPLNVWSEYKEIVQGVRQDAEFVFRQNLGSLLTKINGSIGTEEMEILRKECIPADGIKVEQYFGYGQILLVPLSFSDVIVGLFEEAPVSESRVVQYFSSVLSARTREAEDRLKNAIPELCSRLRSARSE